MWPHLRDEQTDCEMLSDQAEGPQLQQGFELILFRVASVCGINLLLCHSLWPSPRLGEVGITTPILLMGKLRLGKLIYSLRFTRTKWWG